jgi:hypothetical protein
MQSTINKKAKDGLKSVVVRYKNSVINGVRNKANLVSIKVSIECMN